MIGWWALAKYLLIAGLIAGGVYWVSQGQYAKGYTKGKADGEEAASAAVNRMRDKQEEGLVSDIKAEQAAKLAALEKQYREKERRYAAESLAAQLRVQAALDDVAATRDSILERLRDTRASREAGARSNLCRVPPAPGDKPTGTVPRGILDEQDERVVVGRAADAERINALYGQCRETLIRWQRGEKTLNPSP